MFLILLQITVTGATGDRGVTAATTVIIVSGIKLGHANISTSLVLTKILNAVVVEAINIVRAANTRARHVTVSIFII